MIEPEVRGFRMLFLRELGAIGVRTRRVFSLFVCLCFLGVKLGLEGEGPCGVCNVGIGSGV